MPKFKKINLELGMWEEVKRRNLQPNQPAVSLTDILEELDPSSNYPDVKLDAFERQLAARGLVVRGPKSVRLDQFYDPDNIVLFPEFITREVRAGQLLGRTQCRTTDLIAAETEIDSGVYDAAILDMAEDELSMKIVGELATFPKVTIKSATKPITLRKHGMRILESYEHARRISANLFAVFLRQVGQKMEKDMVEDALDVLINGNPGNSNAGFAFNKTTLNYDNLVDFWAEFDPFESTVLVAPKAGVTGILKLQEFKDAMVGFDFQRTGNLITPLGNEFRRHDTSLLTNKILGVDTRSALEKVRERGASLVEADKIIRQQANEIVVSEVVGFSKILAKAAGVWDYS